MFSRQQDDIKKRTALAAAGREAREMGELSIRRNREISVLRYQKADKSDKQSGVGQMQKAVSAQKADTVSETLRQLMGRVDQAGRHLREGRRTLQSGEAALAEVQDCLGRMEKLAQQAADGGVVDREALQAELERLRGEIDRIAQEGIKEGLFQDGDGLDALVDAVLESLSVQQEGAQGLPAWLTQGISGEAPDRAALLAALGLDSGASGAEVLAALGKLPLESSPAAGYLAALYLGAVISRGTPSGAVNPEQAAEGLRQLLEKVAEGLSPDQAVEFLTGGAFTSLDDFQAQFTGGTAPGLDAFLMELLFTGEAGDALSTILELVAGGGGDMDMLMDLLAALGGSGDGLLALLDGAGAPEGARGAVSQLEAMGLGTVQVSGRDLSGVALDAEGDVLTVGGAEELTLRGLGQEAPAIRLIGSGTVTLQQLNAPLLTADGAQARLVSAAENTLAQLQLGQGTVLTLDGGGLLHIGQLRSGAVSVLRLIGGAVVLDGESGEKSAGALAASVVVDGPAALLAAEGVAVRDAQGKPLTPFDIVWKTLLPEWSALTALGVDGKQGQLALQNGQMELLRLWLWKGNENQGFPAHTIVLKGRDKAGHPRAQYVYVRWDEKRGSFQQISMYPNPFTVTGGEIDVDWSYEEETHTLSILTNLVTGIAGGAGTDANLLPFSGRMVLADGIGRVELTLDSVECRVHEGRAFYLGRGNDVTLLLQRGTDSVFESGPGYAGISMGDGTSLCVDQTKGGRGEPDGALTATGGSGGAGIGRDKGAGRERTGSILIRAGVVTATATGGGAGIGGALGAPVGDIRIQGGTVTAQASCSAAAIGAGLQGACGDIVITGSARVVKAQGGGPDGDIGGCLFGSCGQIRVSAGTDIGGAKLWTREGLSIPLGESSVTLPRFRVSARALRLDELDVSTREAARAAMEVITSDRRWVTRLQGAYGAMYGQMAQSFGGMYSVHRYFSVVRDTNEASSLVYDIREVLRQSPLAKFLAQRGMEDVGQLLR